MKKYVLLAVAALVGLAAVSCKSEKEAEDALMMVQTSDEETFDALGTMTE